MYINEIKYFIFQLLNYIHLLEFDIWPELNGVYIMYYLFNCEYNIVINICVCVFLG